MTSCAADRVRERLKAGAGQLVRAKLVDLAKIVGKLQRSDVVTFDAYPREAFEMRR